MTISLLFGVHAHQPVGNFPAVIDDAHVRCYGMFLRVMENYPAFRFSVHFSGWLLDYLLAHFPEDMERLAMMTRRGQVEWFGSGDCEPVLAAIPQRDRISQIVTLSDRIERHFGQRPQGAWLTERVWESTVAPSLVATGMRYVAVDDYHFLCAGQAADRLDSFYTTEEDGQRLDLFPIAEAARYRLPFSPAAETVAWLEDLARQGQRASIYFDDIEKFGIWPETYAWVYERGWLTQFIEGVLASSLIRTETFADYHAGNATCGIVYLPTTSYIEMNEWTLPCPRARDFHALVQAEKDSGHFEINKPFLRGGIWRNFMSRYPEANWLHKRMLSASARLAAMPPVERSAAMQEHLHRAQANDAYWHGLFGGLYLPHLRRAVWNNLLALEALLPPGPAHEQADFDSDGNTEAVLRNDNVQAWIRRDGHAAVLELSSLALAHNFGDTLCRYAEFYHHQIVAQKSVGPTHQDVDSGIASAHDRIAFRHEILPGDAEPDTRPRGLFMETLCWPDGRSEPVGDYQQDESLSDCECYIARGEGWTLSKRYRLDGNTLTVAFALDGERLPSHLLTEINVAMPSCDGFGGRYVLPGGEIPGGFGKALHHTDFTSIRLEDSELKGALEITLPSSGQLRPGGIAVPPAPTFNASPHLTVSQSEAGFEKIMQAVCVTLSWAIPGPMCCQVSLQVDAAS